MSDSCFFNDFQQAWFQNIESQGKLSPGIGSADFVSQFKQNFAKHRSLVYRKSSWNEDMEHNTFFASVTGLERRSKQYFKVALKNAFDLKRDSVPCQFYGKKVTSLDFMVNLDKLSAMTESQRIEHLLEVVTDKAFGLEFTQIVVVKREIRHVFKDQWDAYAFIFYHD